MNIYAPVVSNHELIKDASLILQYSERCFHLTETTEKGRVSIPEKELDIVIAALKELESQVAAFRKEKTL